MVWSGSSATPSGCELSPLSAETRDSMVVVALGLGFEN